MSPSLAYEPLHPKETKLVKKEIRRKLFPAAALALLLFLIAFIYGSLNKNFGGLFLLLAIISVAAGIITFYFLSRKLFHDLKQGNALCTPGTVEEKKYLLSYEAGSASLSIAQGEMKELHWYSLIVNGEEIPVSKEEFEQTEKGQQVSIRKAPKTGLLLSVINLQLY